MPTPLEALCMSHLTYAFSSEAQHIQYHAVNLANESKLDLVFNTKPPNSSGKIDVSYVAGLNSFYQTTTNIVRIVKYLMEKGWFYSSYRTNNQSGYQGVVFINHVKKEIVLAHRGTVAPLDIPFKANAKCDVQILSGKRVEFTEDLACLLNTLTLFITQLVRNRADNVLSYTISQTGHSLGGFLAEYGSAYISNPKSFLNKNEKICPDIDDNFDYLTKSRPHHGLAITFDSIGSVNVLNKLKIPLTQTNSEHYFLEPNIANTANGHHNGARYILLARESNCFDYNAHNHNTALSATVTHNIDELSLTSTSHSLDEMMNYFNLDAGNAHNRQVILSWPTATNTFTIGPKPERSANVSFFSHDTTRFLVASAVHQITDGVISFTHKRTGDLDFENRQNRTSGSKPECSIS